RVTWAEFAQKNEGIVRENQRIHQENVQFEQEIQRSLSDAYGISYVPSPNPNAQEAWTHLNNMNAVDIGKHINDMASRRAEVVQRSACDHSKDGYRDGVLRISICAGKR